MDWKTLTSLGRFKDIVMVLFRYGFDDLVDRLNDYVIAQGGRIYLAKDALTRAEQFSAMEGRLDEFLAVRRRWDPDGRFGSALATRLFGG